MNFSPFYVEKGNGKPLVFLHGNGENHEYFAKQIEYFSKKYKVIAIDTRGHGKSPRGDGDFSIKRFADDLYNFLTEKGIPKVSIVGFSDGGNVALTFALEHIDKVDKLVLNGANLNPSGVRRITQFPIEIGYKIVCRFSDKNERIKQKAELLGLMVNEPDISKNDLVKITVPTLVIAGTRDMIKRAHTEFIAKNIPNAKLIFIKGNHFIANKKSDLFNSAVDEFLSE